MGGRTRRTRDRGFSLMELLVVLTVMGILAGAGVYQLGSRRQGAVRALLDQTEGALILAQRNALVSNQDLHVRFQGQWLSASDPFVLDGRPYESTPANLELPITQRARQGAEAEVFQGRYASGDAVHRHAGIVTDEAVAESIRKDFLESADAAKYSDIRTMVATAPLLLKGDGATQVEEIQGASMRFARGFLIPVAGILGNGKMLATGHRGLLVAPPRSSRVFKLYRSMEDSTWRLL